jgi:hypothetical protein
MKIKSKFFVVMVVVLAAFCVTSASAALQLTSASSTNLRQVRLISV